MIKLYFVAFLTFAFPLSASASELFPKTLSPQTLQALTRMVFQNETNCKKENLISWNEKEDFPSLGVGHAIWFPENVQPGFQETFPSLVDFFRKKHLKNPSIPWPSILNNNPLGPAPWATREDFMSADKTELQNFLAHPEVMAWQTEFMIGRARKSIDDILQKISQEQGRKKAKQVRQILKKLLNTDEGLIAIVDYVNFKGEGLNPKEVTPDESHPWGLKTVLEKMPEVQPQTVVCDSKDVRHYSEQKCLSYTFSEAVFWALARVAQNWGTPGSPAQLTREKWLQGGWVRRIRETYLPGSLDRLNCEI